MREGGVGSGSTDGGEAIRPVSAMNQQAASGLRWRAASLWSAHLSPRLMRLGAVRAPWPLFYVLLVLVKLWLTRGQSLLGIGDSPGDDRLYLQLANHLARGAWLGEYNSLTLAKMPFFPMWVAASFGLGLPLLLGEQLLYAASCVAAVLAIRPVVKSEGARLALFALLLWNPWSFADQVMTRAAREGIYPSLGLLVFASAVGLALRHSAPRATLVRWAVLLGSSGAALWLTREEGVWIVPMVVLGVCVGGIRSPSRRRLLAAVGLAAAIWSAAIGFVLWKNWARYGMAVLSEQTSGPFVDAYRQMVRVRTNHWRHTVPLPREAREKLYLVSPSFARLRNYLEGPDQPNWIAIQCKVTGVCDEISAGAILWAVREAASQENLLRTGPAAGQYWLQVAREIDDACRRHALDCGPTGTGNAVLDTWRVEHWGPFWESLGQGLSTVLYLRGVVSTPTPSAGPLPYLDIFRDLTRERLAGLDAQVRRFRGTLLVSGEPSEWMTVELTNPRGAAAEGYVLRSKEPSVSGTPPKKSSRFEFQVYCPDGCLANLVDTRNGQSLGTLALRSGDFSLAGMTVSLSADRDPSLPRQERLDARRLRILDAVTSVYRAVLPTFASLGLVAWFVSGILAIRIRGVRTLWLISSVALLGFGTRMLLLAVVSAVAFPSMFVLYLSSNPPFLLLFCALALASARRAVDFWRTSDRGLIATPSPSQLDS